jgi:hypothetical protein
VPVESVPSTLPQRTAHVRWDSRSARVHAVAASDPFPEQVAGLSGLLGSEGTEKYYNDIISCSVNMVHTTPIIAPKVSVKLFHWQYSGHILDWNNFYGWHFWPSRRNFICVQFIFMCENKWSRYPNLNSLIYITQRVIHSNSGEFSCTTDHRKSYVCGYNFSPCMN